MVAFIGLSLTGDKKFMIHILSQLITTIHHINLPVIWSSAGFRCLDDGKTPKARVGPLRFLLLMQLAAVQQYPPSLHNGQARTSSQRGLVEIWNKIKHTARLSLK